MRPIGYAFVMWSLFLLNPYAVILLAYTPGQMALTVIYFVDNVAAKLLVRCYMR